MIKWITIVLAVAGLTMGVYTVATSHEVLPDPAPAQPPSVNPYRRGIAASGIVEAASRNIEIAAPEPGLVAEVVAAPNQVVKRGDPLFVMDRRPLEAELMRLEAALAVARAELDRIRAQPRAEDLPPLRAALATANVEAADAADQYERTLRAFKAAAGTEGELSHRKFQAEAAKARVVEAQSRLGRALAGAWSEDIKAAEAKVKQAESEISALKIRLERTIVRAPIDGVVMKRFIEPGEYAMINVATPAMVLGDLSSLNVRAQVDEEDTPLLLPGAEARARLRGALNREFRLHMLRIEPWAQPKMTITGATAERVDTRVVDVVFRLERLSSPGDDGPMPYAGQVVDVYIQATESLPGTAPATVPH